VGYLSSPSLLWYATGGLAYGDDNRRLQTAFACATCGPPVSTVNLTDNWQVGWTVGRRRRVEVSRRRSGA